MPVPNIVWDSNRPIEYEDENVVERPIGYAGEVLPLEWSNLTVSNNVAGAIRALEYGIAESDGFRFQWSEPINNGGLRIPAEIYLDYLEDRVGKFIYDNDTNRFYFDMKWAYDYNDDTLNKLKTLLYRMEMDCK